MISFINEIYTKIEIQNSYEISQENFKKLTLIISSIRNLRSEFNISYKHQIKLNINLISNETINDKHDQKQQTTINENY